MLYRAQLSIDTTLYPFKVTESMTHFRHLNNDKTNLMTQLICQKALGLYTSFLWMTYYGTTWTLNYKQIDCALRP